MKFTTISLVVIILIQFIQIDITQNTKNDDNEINAPISIKKILKRSCYDCHSNNTTIPWYGQIAPVSFFVKGHIKNGRKALNFSNWYSYSHKKQDEKLEKIYKTVKTTMPLKSYILLHQDAFLSHKDIKELRKWTNKSIF